jgi:transposase-like protein
LFILGRLEVVYMSDVGVRESVGTTPQSSVEVVAVAKRRRFTAEYRHRILDELDRAGPGEIGLVLRREGLYSSLLSKWRIRRNQMTSKKKVPGPTNELKTENQRLQKENARLKLKLRKAEAMLDLQKKAAEILSLDDESERSDS